MSENIVTLYESNADAVYLGIGEEVWDLGPVTPDMAGCFGVDAPAWVSGLWEPSEGCGQTPTTSEGLKAVATWQSGAIKISDDFWTLGAGARTFLGHLLVWSVVRGPSPDARAVEPQPCGIDIPDAVLTWGEQHGLSADDPDVSPLVTTAEAAGQVDGEIAYVYTSTTPEIYTTVRRELFLAEVAETNNAFREGMPGSFFIANPGIFWVGSEGFTPDTDAALADGAFKWWITNYKINAEDVRETLHERGIKL